MREIHSPKYRGMLFREKKCLRQAHRPRGGWSAHAIVTSYNYTDTLHVYRHPTSIQKPYRYTVSRIQVQTPQIQIHTSLHQTYKGRHQKYMFRHTNTSSDTQNTSSDTQIQVQTPKIQVWTLKMQVQTTPIHAQTPQMHISGCI